MSSWRNGKLPRSMRVCVEHMSDFDPEQTIARVCYQEAKQDFFLISQVERSVFGKKKHDCG
jgi:hypothetical protein